MATDPRLTMQEFCQCVEIRAEVLIEIIEHGIIAAEPAPLGDWRFDPALVPVARRAARLRRDLGIDWAGVALALDLLADVERLRRENRQLRQRLERFVESARFIENG